MLVLAPRGMRFAERDFLLRLHGEGVGKSVLDDPKVIIDLRPDRQFFQRRNGHISGDRQFQVGRLIGQNAGDQFGRILVGSTLGVDQFQLQPLSLLQIERCCHRTWKRIAWLQWQSRSHLWRPGRRP